MSTTTPASGPMRRLPIALLFAAILAIAPSVALAVGFRYALQYSDPLYLGVDGYLRQSGIVMNNANVNHVNVTLQLCPPPVHTQDCTSQGWVQLGQYQGTIGNAPCPGPSCIRTVQFVHGYYENYLPCTGYVAYTVHDTGDEHVDPNVAYYVNWIGTGLSPCDRTQQKFAFRKGSITNPPDGYGFLSYTTGWPWAAKEIYEGVGSETAGLDRFGLDDNNQVNPSFGLHLKDPSTGQWNLWPSAFLSTSKPPYYCVIQGVSPWAFRTRETVVAGCV